MTYALQNACLNACAYLTMPVSMYVCLLLRDKLVPLFSGKELIPIQDYYAITSKNLVLTRIIVLTVIAVPLIIPALLIKVENVGSPIVIMFTNIAVPLGIGAFVIIGGLYEVLIDKFAK